MVKKKQFLQKVLSLKQWFTKHIKMVKDINIEHRRYYCFSGMIDLKDFNKEKLKLNKKNHKHIGIYRLDKLQLHNFLTV